MKANGLVRESTVNNYRPSSELESDGAALQRYVAELSESNFASVIHPKPLT